MKGKTIFAVLVVVLMCVSLVYAPKADAFFGSKYKDENKILKGKLAMSQKEAQDVKAKLAKKDAQISEITEKKNAVAKEVAGLKKQVEKAKADLEASQKELTAAQEQIESLEEKVAAAEKKTADAEKAAVAAQKAAEVVKEKSAEPVIEEVSDTVETEDQIK